jgi:hypothetical protein
VLLDVTTCAPSAIGAPPQPVPLGLVETVLHSLAYNRGSGLGVHRSAPRETVSVSYVSGV